VIAAGRSDHTTGWNRLRQQVRERAARLERTGVLQAFEFQRQRSRPGAEIRQVDMEDWRMADVRSDQPLGFGNAVRRDRFVQRHQGAPRWD
jgi:hypothetical protein